MAVVIKNVARNSPAFKKHIKSGFVLEKINGNEIFDVLDYRFYMSEERLLLSLTDSEGKKKLIAVNKAEDEDLGLEFETYLMDSQQHCKNKCIFCFIDQLPKGMRNSLYFKDDDSRLSFLTGNYITLTNLSERDVSRIIKMHISPINISVHTMNPELRVKMMKNQNSGKCLSIIKKFAENEIKMNTQIVLCPTINDKEELKFTLEELGKLYPSVSSVAVVPVGLTKFRDNLYPLSVFDKDGAGETIDIIENFSNNFFEQFGSRLAFPADEFFIMAKREMPTSQYYEDFSQIENGVGLWASLKDEFICALEGENDFHFAKNRTVSVATGVAAYPLIKELMVLAEKKFSAISVKVYCVRNEFFGENITVAGLIVGKDLVNRLKNEDLGEELLISSAMLRHERDMFLDSMTLKQVEHALNTKITVTENDGYDLLNKILGK